MQAMEEPEPAWVDVDDTPMFTQRAADLEATAKRLRERCAALLAGARKYRDGLAAMCEAQLAFAAALQEFGGGSDDDSLALGSALMGQFIKAFRELSSYYELLRTQVEVGMVERLHKEWIDGRLSAVKEEARRYDRRCAEAEAARVKYLALKKVTKKEVLERAWGELACSRREADEARYALARALAEVEGAKRHAFLELMVGCLHAQRTFFHAGGESLRPLEGPINSALQIAEHLRHQDDARTRQLEAQIAQHRQEAAAREQLVAAAHYAGDAAFDGAGGAHAASAGATGGGGNGGNVPGAPLQMSSRQGALLTETERLIAATQASGGTQVTLLHRGYLNKRSSGKGRSDWKRRFFVLDSLGMLYYYSHKADNSLLLSRTARPKNTVSLLTASVKLDAEDGGVRCAFRVVSPEAIYTLQADNEIERREWIDTLHAVINCLLTGAVDMAAMPRKPSRPTHSRHSSTGAGGALGGGSDAGNSGGGGGGWDGSGAATPSSTPGTPYAAPHGTLQSVASGQMFSDLGTAPGFHPLPLPDTHNAGGPQSTRHTRRASAGDATALTAPPQPPGGAVRTLTPPSRLRQASGGARAPPAPLERLRRVRGNSSCADCGAGDPDWASLNLGVLLCIECSGIHRQLGVHVSKVRSCTLDVRAWEEPVPELFEAIGNAASNAVWEGGVQAVARLRQQTDGWVWCDDSDDGDEGGGAGAAAGAAPERRSGRQSSSGGGSGAVASRSSSSSGRRRPDDESALLTPAAPIKPPPGAPLADKQRYVTDKYVARAFVAPWAREGAQAALWDAAEASDVQRALAALAGGANVRGAYRTPRALALVEATAALHARLGAGAGGGGEAPASAGCGEVTALHAAAAAGDAVVLEFLLLNGASWEAVDSRGMGALHYAILHDRGACVKLLLRRGAGAVPWRDARGRAWTALDLSMLKGRISDEDLFLALNASGSGGG